MWSRNGRTIKITTTSDFVEGPYNERRRITLNEISIQATKKLIALWIELPNDRTTATYVSARRRGPNNDFKCMGHQVIDEKI